MVQTIFLGPKDIIIRLLRPLREGLAASYGDDFIFFFVGCRPSLDIFHPPAPVSSHTLWWAPQVHSQIRYLLSVGTSKLLCSISLLTFMQNHGLINL